MDGSQRQLIFVLSIVVAVVLAVVAYLYHAGHMFYPTGVHDKHALLAGALAVVALVVANFNRPGVVDR
jgi:hypothetical protein